IATDPSPSCAMTRAWGLPQSKKVKAAVLLQQSRAVKAAAVLPQSKGVKAAAVLPQSKEESWGNG
ncbi:MAG: hypothetical protein JSU73_02860, partial [candidate division WOR-3 bacterium]